MNDTATVSASFLALSLLVADGAGAVVIDTDDRRRPTAAEYGLHAATGRLSCAGVASTAQLTGSNRVITTVAHGFYGKNGRPRTAFERCTFRVAGRTYRIEADGVVVGSTNPYRTAGTSDWAVARLSEPVRGVTPYSVARPSRVMTLVAQGHTDRMGGMTIQTCRAFGRGPEIKTDCDTGAGGPSGAAFLTPGTRRMFAIFVGFRSSAPRRAAPFDARTHHNYGVAVRGAMAKAIRRLSR